MSEDNATEITPQMLQDAFLAGHRAAGLEFDTESKDWAKFVENLKASAEDARESAAMRAVLAALEEMPIDVLHISNIMEGFHFGEQFLVYGPTWEGAGVPDATSAPEGWSGDEVFAVAATWEGASCWRMTGPAQGVTETYIKPTFWARLQLPDPQQNKAPLNIGQIAKTIKDALRAQDRVSEADGDPVDHGTAAINTGEQLDLIAVADALAATYPSLLAQ